ncbi:MAG: hypothetical protein ACRDNS_17535 [Trebonia sp.]
MTGSDLIVLAPWIIFAVCLLVLCTRLRRAHRSTRRRDETWSPGAYPDGRTTPDRRQESNADR